VSCSALKLMCRYLVEGLILAVQWLRENSCNWDIITGEVYSHDISFQSKLDTEVQMMISSAPEKMNTGRFQVENSSLENVFRRAIARSGRNSSDRALGHRKVAIISACQVANL